MLFNFTLKPVAEISPWDPTPHLHWFGLTDGAYWLQAGTHELLRYSDAALQSFQTDDPSAGLCPYVDYYVVRLFEDIWEMAPVILEPVPNEFVPYASSASREEWKSGCQRWLDRQSESGNDVWDVHYTATVWLSRRSLDTGYLSPSARIWFWRHGDVVTIAWDNRDRYLDDIPAWSERQGQFSMSVQDFSDELQSFRDRFLTNMRERVEEVRRSWSRPDVAIDRDELAREQALREEAAHLGPASPPTDWSGVLRAINKIAGS